jgi:hypothetical protein
MVCASRSIARLLIAVLLATVLSPSFAWESTARASAHGHDCIAPDATGDARDNAGPAGSHRGDEDSHHHHGCAGHLFGHLPMHLSEAFAFAIFRSDRDRCIEPAAALPLPFPDRLDRPPHVPALA